MKQRNISLLILIWILFLNPFYKTSAAPAKNFIWEVKSKNTTIYLLGSVHIGKESLFPLKPVIEDAFKSSQNLALELDITNLNPMELFKYMTFQDTMTLKSSLSATNYEKLVDIFKENSLPELVYQKLKPWAAVLTAQQLQYSNKGFKASSGIDMYFLNRAKGVGEYAEKDSIAGKPQKKKIYELETGEFQLKLFDEFNPVANSFVEYSLEDMKDTSENNDLDKIYAAWEVGKSQDIEDIIIGSQKKFPAYQQIMEKLLYERNRNMTSKIASWLDTKETYFVVVGAAHLVGKKGIVELLKKMNKFTIKQL